MSTLRVNTITNNGSAVDLPQKFKIGGSNVEQGYTASGSEPSSPATGDFWWDSSNEKLYRYINGEFKELTLGGSSATANGWYNRQTQSGFTSATGSSNYPTYISVVSDSSGNIYTVGEEAGRNSTFYSKFDTDGAHQWTKAFNNNVYYNIPRAIALDSSGSNVFLFGYDYGQGENFNSDQSPDPVMAIIMKVSAADGSVVDTKWLRWNTISSNQAFTSMVDACVDSNNNLWCVYQGSASYGGASSNDITVFKLNSSLALQAVYRIASSQNYTQNPYTIKADSDDNIYIAGIALGASSGAYHNIVVKLNSSGVIQWTKIFGSGAVTAGGYDRIFTGPVFDSNKDLYVGGAYRAGSGSGQAPYVAKLNATNGNIEWAKVFSTAAPTTYGTFNMALHNDVIYAAAEGDTSLNDIIIAQFNTSGTMTSAHQVRSSGELWNDETTDLLNTDSNGNLLFAAAARSGSSWKPSLIKFPATISAGTFGDLTVVSKSTTTTNATYNNYTHTSLSVSNITSSFQMSGYISGTYGNPASLQSITVSNDLDAYNGS